jgi:16S rRNA (cytosine967-C5)-methyltransferase
LGTLRRSPDLKWREQQSAIADFATNQNAILASAARLVKQGGRLVYATCSLLDQENEDVAAAFSNAHSNFTPVSVVNTLNALKVANANQLCSADGLYLRLWPNLHATDGFFAAAWTRRQ